MRAIVLYATAPATKVSTILINEIVSYCEFNLKYSIKNSYELVNNIQNINTSNIAKCISFYVVNLFPSIPSKNSLKLEEESLKLNNVNPVIHSKNISLLEICLH